jgi:4a-hydroxytetrahydrobiopterin dehydratase
MARLDDGEIARRLKEVPGWERSGESLRREFHFDGFSEAIAFVNRVAALADAADHHPDIDIRFDKVSLQLTTHDSGGLTERDFTLAQRIDA